MFFFIALTTAKAQDCASINDGYITSINDRSVIVGGTGTWVRHTVPVTTCLAPCDVFNCR